MPGLPPAGVGAVDAGAARPGRSVDRRPAGRAQPHRPPQHLGDRGQLRRRLRRRPPRLGRPEPIGELPGRVRGDGLGDPEQGHGLAPVGPTGQRLAPGGLLGAGRHAPILGLPRPRLQGGQLGGPLLRPPPPRRLSRPAPIRTPPPRAAPASPLRDHGAAPRTGHGGHYRSPGRRKSNCRSRATDGPPTAGHLGLSGLPSPRVTAKNEITCGARRTGWNCWWPTSREGVLCHPPGLGARACAGV